ncbi:MAG: tRNA (guanosine(46)-N7)-methyltransferase TrmB [Chthoniobacteraceae bacterium]
MTPTQRTAYLEAAELAKWKPADYFRETPVGEFFARPAPLVLDLGCGDGGFLIAMAKRNPEENFLATERLPSRVEKVARKIARSGLANARVLELESHYAVRWLLPAACASVVYVLHPDPWPKRQHHPRRLIQVEFMEAVHRVLAPGGELRVKTDDKPYFQWMEKVFAQCPQFERLEWDEPADWPQTDFERDFVAKGLPIYRARLRKV